MANRWLSRVTVAVAVVGAVVLATATSAWADTKIFINDQQVPTTAEEFDGDTCTAPLDKLDDDQDGWHFSLPAASGDDFVSLTLTFDTPGGTVTATITSTNAGAPSTGLGWLGWIDNAGNSGSDKHAYAITDAGWELTAGEAMVTGDTGQNPQFVLSHTCAGTPGNGSTPTPGNGSSDPPGNGSSNPPGGGGGGGGLPVTGTAIGGIVVIGIGLVAAGVALMAVRRRRDVTNLTEL